MKDSNLLLETLEAIDSKMQSISYEKTIVDEISDSFTLMGEYFEILNINYNNFTNALSFVLTKIKSLNEFVSADVLEEYYGIYRNVGDNLGETYHKLSSISEELKK